VSSRDVEETLDRLMAYYARQEPSSPVPILLARAKKLVGADFMTIVREIAPGGADNVKLIGGLE
jgi:type VI secretion system protein ImpA